MSTVAELPRPETSLKLKDLDAIPDSDANPNPSVMTLEDYLFGEDGQIRNFWWINEDCKIDAGNTKTFLGTGSPLDYKTWIGSSSKCSVSAFECYDSSHRSQRELVAVKSKQVALGDRESHILRQLRHPHIIGFVGSYHQGNTLSVVLFPLAKYDLLKYMSAASNANQDVLGTFPNMVALPRTPTFSRKARHWKLITFLPCLANALKYLHDPPRIVKHKDIKPHNILICRYGTPILTDFDISNDYTDQNASVTTGETSLTIEYASKEAAKWKDRTLACDVFSLGCVFLEMVTVVLGETLENLWKAMGRPANAARDESQTSYVYWDAVATGRSQEWFKRLRHICFSLAKIEGASVTSATDRVKISDYITDKTIDLIESMMSDEAGDRPELAEIVSKLVAIPTCKVCDNMQNRTANPPVAEAGSSSISDTFQPRARTLSPPRMRRPTSPKMAHIDENDVDFDVNTTDRPAIVIHSPAISNISEDTSQEEEDINDLVEPAPEEAPAPAPPSIRQAPATEDSPPSSREPARSSSMTRSRTSQAMTLDSRVLTPTLTSRTSHDSPRIIWSDSRENVPRTGTNTPMIPGDWVLCCEGPLGEHIYSWSVKLKTHLRGRGPGEVVKISRRQLLKFFDTPRGPLKLHRQHLAWPDMLKILRGSIRVLYFPNDDNDRVAKDLEF